MAAGDGTINLNLPQRNFSFDGENTPGALQPRYRFENSEPGSTRDSFNPDTKQTTSPKAKLALSIGFRGGALYFEEDSGKRIIQTGENESEHLPSERWHPTLGFVVAARILLYSSKDPHVFYSPGIRVGYSGGSRDTNFLIPRTDDSYASITTTRTNTNRLEFDIIPLATLLAEEYPGVGAELAGGAKFIVYGREAEIQTYYYHSPEPPIVGIQGFLEATFLFDPARTELLYFYLSAEAALGVTEVSTSGGTSFTFQPTGSVGVTVIPGASRRAHPAAQDSTDSTEPMSEPTSDADDTVVVVRPPTEEKKPEAPPVDPKKTDGIARKPEPTPILPPDTIPGPALTAPEKANPDIWAEPKLLHIESQRITSQTFDDRNIISGKVEIVLDGTSQNGIRVVGQDGKDKPDKDISVIVGADGKIRLSIAFSDIHTTWTYTLFDKATGQKIGEVVVKNPRQVKKFPKLWDPLE